MAKDESDYIVTNTKRIIEHLHTLMRKKCMLSVHFGEYSQSFITILLGIDESTKTIQFDAAPSAILNKGLLNAPKALFRTEVDGIKVSFKGTKIRSSQENGAPSLSMPIPESLYWLQRREYFRVRVPQCHTGSHCKVEIMAETDAGEVTTIQDLKLIDIGAKGFALLTPSEELPAYFSMSDTNENIHATLYLNDGSHGDVSFTVRYTMEVKTSPSHTQHRIGCMLTETSTTFESQLQRYMQQIEIQNRNIAGDQ